MTDAEPQNFTPDERKLLVRAVAAFSDRCELPNLTPECPFFELTGQGPMCAEQCRDLIAENVDDLPKPEIWSLGGALAAQRRPTPRHGPREGEPAFDAGQVRLEDQNKQVSLRRMTALTAELEHSLTAPPEDDTAARCSAIVVELRQRGVDVETLIRQGLGRKVVTGVVVLAMGAKQREESEGQDWLDLIDEVVPLEETDVPGDLSALLNRAFSNKFLSVLNCWLATAPIEDLIRHQPPTSDQVKQGLPISPGPHPDRETTWFVDRFTQTYLPSWSLSSLRLEWRYQHAFRPGCVSAASMRERRIDRGELATFIADAAVDDWEHKEEADDGGSSHRHPEFNVQQFLSVALNALNEGRRDDAVSLYRSILELEDNAEVRNNLGFCLLPDYPADAVEHLLVATADEGFSGRATSFTNLALAYHMVGERKLGLEAIDAALDLVSKDDNAWMWPLTGAKDKPTESIALLSYSEDLKATIEAME